MASSIRISHPTKKISGSFMMPGSKSESNRALIINKLSGNKIHIENLSSAEDTQNLVRLLARHSKELDVKDAGTSMRFLTACFCVMNKNKIITGSQRMLERPVGKLVNALREIGFKIYYLKTEGFPPLEIIPSEHVHFKFEVNVEADESSQFISALLMIAPMFPDGLTLKLQKKIVSTPYIEMTLKMMNFFGVNHQWKKNEIRIDHQHYKESVYKVEGDWSAASYWYSIAALSDEAEIVLPGLKKDSLQGDAIISEWMENFGVTTEYFSTGIKIKKEKEPSMNEMSFDFTGYPDLAQTIIVLAAAKNINLQIKGLKTLKLKETDRVAALQKELKKIGADLIQIENDLYKLKTDFKAPVEKIETYNDHRMAMSFAPLAVKNEITILDPKVVAKSYHEFWVNLKDAGFV